MNNFIGKWWVGVVENTEDPLKTGRCKVRIFGYHTENLLDLPTNDLPWCTIGMGPSQPDSFAVPIPGDYVTGYFSDGESGQNPYIVSILPGIQSKAWDTSKGFSPQPLVPGAPKTEAEIAKPVLPNGVTEREIGQPTTPKTARGILEGTGISVTNGSLSHVCDFRYQFNFNIGSLGLINPITAIQQAIKNGKNNAANFIGMLISKLNAEFRLIIKGILISLNLDPTGTLSAAYSYLKNKIRDINDIIKKVAKQVEIAATIVYLVKDIQKIVDYLKNLPARFQAMVQNCIATFMNGIKAFATQVASIPGQIGTSIEGLAAGLQSSANSALESLGVDISSVTIPESLSTVISAPDTTHADIITTYIGETYSPSNVAAITAENTFDPTKMEWA